MPLTPVTFTLTPNQYDGRQRLSDPSGTEQPPASTLQPVTSLTISNTTSNSQTLTWQHDEGDGIEGYAVQIWVASQDTTWRTVGDVPVGTKTFTSSGLPGGRYIRYRVAAYIADPLQVSSWVEVDGSTLAAPGSGTETDLLALTFFYNFEHLSPGEGISGQDGFSIAGNFTCDASKTPAAPNGTRCGHTFIDSNSSAGDEDAGWGDWGYAQTGLPDALEGAEVWWRKAIFWPTNSYFGSSGALLKQMRFRRHALSDGDNRGSTEFGLGPNQTVFTSVEYVDSTLEDPWGKPTTGIEMPDAYIPFGRWVWWECYVKLSPDPNVGVMATWVDTVPCGRFNSPTMSRPSLGPDRMDELFMGTWWNGYDGSKPYSETWYDQIAVAMDGPVIGGSRSDKQHLATDSDGYAFIGDAVNTDILR